MDPQHHFRRKSGGGGKAAGVPESEHLMIRQTQWLPYMFSAPGELGRDRMICSVLEGNWRDHIHPGKLAVQGCLKMILFAFLSVRGQTEKGLSQDQRKTSYWCVPTE